MELREWQIKVEVNQEAVFDLGNGTYIRVRIDENDQRQIYVKSFPGVLSIMPNSGNAAYMTVIPIFRAERVEMTGQEIDEMVGPGQADAPQGRPITDEEYNQLIDEANRVNNSWGLEPGVDT